MPKGRINNSCTVDYQTVYIYAECGNTGKQAYTFINFRMAQCSTEWRSCGEVPIPNP
jgi:hypothetical protein